MSDGETRYKLTLHYDGAAFRGWQVQPGQPTVQGALEGAVRRLAGERRPVVGAGRTDTGVHALGQVAAVTMPAPWTAATLADSLNALLPDAVWVRDAEAVPPEFNPRTEATARHYEYRVGTAPASASPFHRRWCWPLGRALDADALGRAAARLAGTRSFRAFAKSGQPKRGYLCCVFDAGWHRWDDLGLAFHVSANRFLHRMVRYLVGTMVEIGIGRRDEDEMARLLKEDPGIVTSPPAPPQGLFLTQVRYGARASWTSRVAPTSRVARVASRASWVAVLAAVAAGSSTACGPESGGATSREAVEHTEARRTVHFGPSPSSPSHQALAEGVATPNAAVAEPRRSAASVAPRPTSGSAAVSPWPTSGSAAAAAPQSTSGSAAATPRSTSDSRLTAIVEAARSVAPAVVSISVRRRERVHRRSFFDDYFLPFRETQGLGSGFVVDAGGTVVTNHHVVENASEILVSLPDGRDFPARLAGADPVVDVAVLLIDGAPHDDGELGADDLPTAPLGTARDLMIGEWTVAIGNPFGQLISNAEPSVSAGVVSALGRHIVPQGDGEGVHLGMIQTDAAINPGNSGGPLVNALGEVIGVNTSILSRSGGSEGLGFAIPIDRALRVVHDLAEHGEVRRAWLGLEVDAVEADAFGRSSGVRAARVAPGSPAAEAGIREGARLLRAGGSRMATTLDYAAVLLDLRAGDMVRLELEGKPPILVRAARLPSAVADRVALLDDLEVVTVTPEIRAERKLASPQGALVVELSAQLSRATGLGVGDVVLAVNQHRVTTAEEAAEELRRTQRSRRPFVLSFERDGRVVRTGLLEWSRRFP